MEKTMTAHGGLREEHAEATKEPDCIRHCVQTDRQPPVDGRAQGETRQKQGGADTLPLARRVNHAEAKPRNHVALEYQATATDRLAVAPGDQVEKLAAAQSRLVACGEAGWKVQILVGPIERHADRNVGLIHHAERHVADVVAEILRIEWPSLHQQAAYEIRKPHARPHPSAQAAPTRRAAGRDRPQSRYRPVPARATSRSASRG